MLAVVVALGAALLLAGPAGSARTPGPVAEEWSARYHRKSPEPNFLHGLAVDGAGDVYVTGSSGEPSSDFATVKYDGAKGKELWDVRYDGPGAGSDTPRALAADEAGNVYVTGWSHGIGTSADFATIKYDASGRQLWVRRYDGPAHGFDTPAALEVDDAGNVYVAGTAAGAAGSEATTIKYDAAGNELWVARHTGAGASALALDDAGHVYVTGSSGGEFLTVEYDAAGTELWTARYAGPTADPRESARDVGVDSAGNVYVTGESWGGANPGTFVDVATVKYDGNGNEVWVRRFDAAGANDEPAALAVAGNGDVHVAADADWKAPAFRDVTTLKYDASGNLEWAARHPGSGASDVVLDAGGNVYVNASVAGPSSGDLAAVKYDSAGNQLWEAAHDAPFANEQARALAVDRAGGVLVAGDSPGGDTSWDYLTVKFVQREAQPK